MEELLKIAQLISSSMSLELNEYKSYYEDPHVYYMVNTSVPPDLVGEIDWEKDIWELRVYPRTPISFFHGISNDLEALLKWAVDILENGT